MTGFFTGLHPALAPQSNDSLAELQRKAESALDFLRKNEAFLRKIPTSFVEERLQDWQGLADLLAKAIQQPELETDARLEANRIWAEEHRCWALYVITMCAHLRSDKARAFFSASPESREESIASMEQQRPTALTLLSAEDRNELREHGFLRDGE
jgi:hypothetical protein